MSIVGGEGFEGKDKGHQVGVPGKSYNVYMEDGRGRGGEKKNRKRER